MDERDTAIEALAARQCGRFTRAQVASVSGDADGARVLVQNRLRSHRWRRVTSRVLKLPGAPDGQVAELWTAQLHLGEDSVISHRSAALLWRMPGVPHGEPALIVPRESNRRLRSCSVHQRGDLATSETTILDGLSLTTATRTLADLAPTSSRSRMELWVDHAIAERLTTLEALRAQVDSLRRSGKVLEPLCSLLLDRLPGPAVEASTLERALTHVLKKAGIPLGVAQAEAPGRPGDRQGLVDRAWSELRWVVEADGRRWHARERAMVSDRERDRNAQALGWLVTRLTHDELVGAPSVAAADLAAIHRRRTDDMRARAARSS